MTNSNNDPAEGSRKTVERELDRQKAGSGANEHPENPEGAAKATKDNDLTTGHSQPGDGGDDNAKNKTK